MVLNRLLRAGEARTVRRLGAIADYVDTFADEVEALSDAELRAKTQEFRERYADGESLDDMLGEAFAVVREGASRTLGQRHYRVQLMGGAALHLGNVAEMRTGEGKTLVSTLPGLPQRHHRRGRPRRHHQRLPRPPRLGVDGPRPPFPRPDGRRHLRRDAPGRAPGRLRGGHHLRHQQRVRLRLPARQHGLDQGRVRAARAPVRDRRRGRLDPHRRGPHAADHLRPGRAERPLVHRVRAARPEDDQGRPLRGRRAQEDRRRHRGGRLLHRGPARDREPLRGREHPAGRLPEQRDQGEGALPQGQGLHRPRRRGPHRRRVHRSRPRGTPLQRGSAPGDRGQGRRSRSSRRTRPSRRSRCRTTSGSTRSSPG